MLLATRCPHCATAFSIGPEQLKLRGGRVRCGVCNEVFDATRHLIDLEGNALPPEPQAPAADVPAVSDVPAPAEPPAPPAVEVQVPVAEALAEAPVEAFEPAAEPAAEPVLSEPMVVRRRGPGGDEKDIDALLDALGAFSAAAQASDPVQTEPRSESLPELRAEPGFGSRTAAGAESPRPMPAAPAAEPLPTITAMRRTPIEPPAYFGSEENEGGNRLRSLWSYGVPVLLLLLIVQGVWAFRTDIATRLPFTRPVFEGICAQFQCTVGYPHAKEQLSIESSSLEPWDAAEPAPAQPAEPGAAQTLPVRRLALTVVLRNRAAFPQDWPAIELSLTDLSDAATARRVLLPAIYLSERERAAPIGVGQERTLRIPIEAIASPASGYRVSIFYP
jgi:predicted Zn finger-like uncharacterized protein